MPFKVLNKGVQGRATGWRSLWSHIVYFTQGQIHFILYVLHVCGQRMVSDGKSDYKSSAYSCKSSVHSAQEQTIVADSLVWGMFDH